MPAWAAAEPAMVYVGNRNGPDEIWFRRGGAPDRPIVTARDFPADTTLWFMAPALSPRGDRVIYTRVERTGEGRLWISAVAGGSPIRATTDNQSGAEFAGSWLITDGTWFAYFAVDGDKLDLMKIQTNGEAAPVMIKAGVSVDAPLPDWSPAGDWIVSGGLVIAPDGKTGALEFGSHQSPHLVFSKDGKRLYGLRPENGQQTLFPIDVAGGTERTIASGIAFRAGQRSGSVDSAQPGTGRQEHHVWHRAGQNQFMDVGKASTRRTAWRRGSACAAELQLVLVGVDDWQMPPDGARSTLCLPMTPVSRALIEIVLDVG